jgi:hypothetical protein
LATLDIAQAAWTRFERYKMLDSAVVLVTTIE